MNSKIVIESNWQSNIMELFNSGTVEQINARARPNPKFPDEKSDEFSKTMRFLLKNSDLSNFIEIGVRRGGSFGLWAHYFEGIKIGIDGDPFPDELNLFPDVFGMQADSHAPVTVEWAEGVLNGQLVDWLFIDGDHKLPQNDYNNYKHLVKPGGYIGFHDIRNKDHVNIGLFWDTLGGDKVEIKHSCGIGIIQWQG